MRPSSPSSSTPKARVPKVRPPFNDANPLAGDPVAENGRKLAEALGAPYCADLRQLVNDRERKTTHDHSP